MVGPVRPGFVENKQITTVEKGEKSQERMLVLGASQFPVGKEMSVAEERVVFKVIFGSEKLMDNWAKLFRAKNHFEHHSFFRYRHFFSWRC